MSSEKGILVAQKAAMFDLIQIIKQQPDKTYTVDEIEALIVAGGFALPPALFMGRILPKIKKALPTTLRL